MGTLVAQNPQGIGPLGNCAVYNAVFFEFLKTPHQSTLLNIAFLASPFKNSPHHHYGCLVGFSGKTCLSLFEFKPQRFRNLPAEAPLCRVDGYRDIRIKAIAIVFADLN